MSFTKEVKLEISLLDLMEIENKTELSVILRNISTIFEDKIIITTENQIVAHRIYKLINDIYYLTPKVSVRKGYNFNKNFLYTLEISKKIKNIIDELCLNDNLPKEYIYDDNELIKAYLRGLFLVSGSINDPKKSRYHLEFLVDNYEYAIFNKKMLNKYHLNAKVLKRENKYMIYVKEAEKIGDFLRVIGANNAVMYFEDIRIYRDHKNMTNRINNCEQANVEKSLTASNLQLEDIKIIEDNDLLSLLDDKLTELIYYRKKYPEESLSDLSEIISIETGNKITKSGLNHRFIKIRDFANKIRNNI